MTYESDSIDKKRQRYDKWSRYTVTAFGGLVLITLVVLISHLLTQSLPLALLPKIQFTQYRGRGFKVDFSRKSVDRLPTFLARRARIGAARF